MSLSPYRVTASGIDGPLRQCEILSGVRRGRFVLDSIGTPSQRFEARRIEWAVILTQDCDLEQDHHVRFPEERADSDKLIPEILLAEVSTAEETFARIAESRKKQWDRLNIEKNKNERFHFLERVEPGCDRLKQGIPELTIDFKRYFTIPTGELYRRIELGETQRRTVLASPYLEHLADRFAAFLSRVALPTDHVSE